MARYIIEIAGRNNERHCFGPTGQTLRGRYDFSNVTHRDKSEAMKAMSRVGVIQGICVELDTDKGLGRVFDPLRETEEGRKKWTEVLAVLREYQFEFGNVTQLMETQEYRDLSQDDVKTWMYEMRKVVDGGCARVISESKLPSLADIRTKVPGKRIRDIWNSGEQTREEGEGKLAKYADYVEVGGVSGGSSGGAGGGGSGGRGRQSSTSPQGNGSGNTHGGPQG